VISRVETEELVENEEFDEARDASRRTRLANERTLMAWVRSGLAAFAVGLGAGKLVPELSGGSDLPFELVGAGFAVLGVLFILYGYVRHQEVERALARGEYVSPSRAFTVALTVLGTCLGLAILVLVFVSG